MNFPASAKPPVMLKKVAPPGNKTLKKFHRFRQQNYISREYLNQPAALKVTHLLMKGYSCSILYLDRSWKRIKPEFEIISKQSTPAFLVRTLFALKRMLVLNVGTDILWFSR